MTSFSRHRGAVRFFSLAMRFGAWLQGFPGRATPPPFRLLQIGSAFWQSRALNVAARLDVATALGDEARTVTELAADVGADPDALYRLLRLLGAIGVFEETRGRRFRNNRVSAWLRQDHPNNMRAMVLMHNSPDMSRPWYEQLEHAVRTGETPFTAAHGMELYRYMDEHPEFDALFAAAMESVDALTGESFATDFDWSRFERIIDIGGSKGRKSLAILKHHPQLRALVFDRPNVIMEAKAYWENNRADLPLDRLSFEAGDMFDSVPPAQSDKDVYFLAAVLHGLADGECATVLGNVVRAGAGKRAPIAIMDIVVPDTQADYMSASFDMQMFMGTRGRERTRDEWAALLGRSGLKLIEVVGTRSPAKILLAGYTGI